MCKCPKCNTELIIKDVTDEDCIGDSIVMEGYGQCPGCKTEYWIDTIYTFSHYDIKEIKED